MDLNGKVIVVTGAGNGIGRQVAIQLLRKGAKVAGVDLSEDGLADTAKLAETGPGIAPFVVDVTDRDAVFALPEQVKERFGQIDGLANVAGIIQKFVPVLELEMADIDKVINVNLLGTLNINKAFLPELVARREAALLNVSSMGGLVPFPGQSVYSASKAGVKLLTEGLRAELIDTNVAVTVVFPGAIATNIGRNSGVDLADVSDPRPQGASIKTTSPEEAGRQIVEALEKGTPRVRIGKDVKMIDRFGRLMPSTSILVIAKRMARAVGAAGR